VRNKVSITLTTKTFTILKYLPNIICLIKIKILLKSRILKVLRVSHAQLLGVFVHLTLVKEIFVNIIICLIFVVNCNISL
jgi:hypothetical protein